MGFLAVSLRLGVLAVIAFSFSCSSKPTDPRTVIPSDALIYLESRDLAQTLEAVIQNPKFQQFAKKKPNVAALRGVSVAIAVTGFETSEQTVTAENSVLNFQPRFVAVAETNAWSWQTTTFIEDHLGEFVNDAYGGDVVLESIPKGDGKFYTWTSEEGRKAYAFHQGSLVYFGNDETAIERCQAVQRGEIESIGKNSKITNVDRLAFGYISADGIGQIANIAGISLAIGASEEEEVKSFVARVLPEILRNSVKEITWTAALTDGGIEDKTVVELEDESARVYAETILPAQANSTDVVSYVPASAATATRYLIRDPQIAWRSVVLTAGKKPDEAIGSLLVAFSGSVFEPYGIEDPEVFLSSIASPLITVELTPDKEDAVVIAGIKDVTKVRSSLAKEINFSKAGEKQFGADVWKSEDGEVAAAFIGDSVVISGDAESVLKCLEAKSAGTSDGNVARQFSSSDAVAVTVANESDSLRKLMSMMSEIPEGENPQAVLPSKTETRFNQKGIERRTISDFGMIGWLIAHMAAE